jgi:hypothetical protein
VPPTPTPVAITPPAPPRRRSRPQRRATQKLEQEGGRTVATERTGEWLTTVAELFRTQVDALPDAALDQPTLLPAVARRQLIGHLRYLAEVAFEQLTATRTQRSVAGIPASASPPADSAARARVARDALANPRHHDTALPEHLAWLTGRSQTPAAGTPSPAPSCAYPSARCWAPATRSRR